MTSSAKAPKKPGPRQAHNDKFHNFKVCRTCEKEKRLADFALTGNWRKKRAADPKRYRRDCKECTRAPSAAQIDPGFKPHRRRRTRVTPRSPADKLAAAAEYKRRVRREARIKALEYVAAKGCCDCNTHDPRVLEFDHIDPSEKSVGIAKLLGDGFGWGAEKLRAEIRKCRVICANCHRKHTTVQQGHYAHADVQSALQTIYEEYDIAE